MDHHLVHNSAPPTPSMTEGPTHSDVSTAKSSSTMSATLHQRLRDRKLELQREGKLGGDEDGSEGSGVDEKRSIAAKERRTVSTTSSTRRTPAQMGFREQEQHIAKLDKQNFDLKLRVYHQEIKIREMRAEVDQKNEEGDELMKLVDDQQKELDKREASLKEAVDSILLLQDKVRHLEKVVTTARPPSNRLRYSVHSRVGESEVLAKPNKAMVHDHLLDGPKLTVRRASLSKTPDELNNQDLDLDGAELELDVPLVEELDAINQDRQGLRARTMSALSRNTEDSRHLGDYIPPRSPAMSVLSEGDFESVYNWKEQSILDTHPPRPHSADFSELWTEPQPALGTTTGNEQNENSQDDPNDNPSRARADSRGLSHKPDYPIPGLEVSNTFNRTTPTKAGLSPYRSLRKRNSDPSLPNHGLATPPNTDQGSPFHREHSGVRSSRKAITDSQDAIAGQIDQRVPATPLRRVRPVMGASKTSDSASDPRSPEKGMLLPRSQRVPSTAPFSARVGRFENYGFLDSQPSTPVLLGKRQHGAKRAHDRQFIRPQAEGTDAVPQEPTSPTPAQPQVASRKDQQILEYIAQQRVNDWIDKAPRRTPAMAAPMFEDRRRSEAEVQEWHQAYRSEYHPLPPTPPDTASAANSASRKTSGTLDTARAPADQHESQPARPNFKRAVESYPALSPSHRSGTLQLWPLVDARDTPSEHARAEPASERARAFGFAGGRTRDVAFNAYDGSADPPPRATVTFAPEVQTQVLHARAAEDADENDDAVLVSPDEVPAAAKSHPPVSLASATSRLGFAGRFRRRRGSSGTGAGTGQGAGSGSGNAGRAGSALQGSITSSVAHPNAAATAETGPESDEAAVVADEEGEVPADGKARRRASFSALKFSTLGRKIF